jgi:hypothetical protein
MNRSRDNFVMRIELRLRLDGINSSVDESLRYDKNPSVRTTKSVNLANHSHLNSGCVLRLTSCGRFLLCGNNAKRNCMALLSARSLLETAGYQLSDQAVRAGECLGEKVVMSWNTGRRLRACCARRLLLPFRERAVIVVAICSL